MDIDSQPSEPQQQVRTGGDIWFGVDWAGADESVFEVNDEVELSKIHCYFINADDGQHEFEEVGIVRMEDVNNG